MARIDFSTADLAGCDFRETVFESGNLVEASLWQVMLGALTVEQAISFGDTTILLEQVAMLVASRGILVL